MSKPKDAPQKSIIIYCLMVIYFSDIRMVNIYAVFLKCFLPTGIHTGELTLEVKNPLVVLS